MSEPRHIGMCIDEWLDGCPFNLPDTLDAIRAEMRPPTKHASQTEESE